ncbi:MAG: BON domain-containing protein [Blastocatellales bacterium]
MKQRLFTAMLAASLVIAATAMARASNTAPQTASQTSREQAYLVKEVRHELLLLPYYNVFDWLSYQVGPDGTVILSGEVVRPTLKSDAENVIKKIEGVQAVVNKIEVLPVSFSDAQIRRNIARAIFNFDSPLYRYGLQAVPSIHIIVKNGAVTLKGVVNSKADSDMANIKANSVPFVFHVENDLTVQKG